MSESDLTTMSKGLQSQQTLDVIVNDLARRENVIVSRVMQALRSQEYLDPQVAVQAWMDIKAVRDLRQNLEKSIKAGQSASRDLVNTSAL